MTSELVIPVEAPTGISMFSGVKAHEVWSGRPEQEMVTNIGAASDAALMGVTVTMADPDWPCLRLKEAGATATEKSGVVPAVSASGVTEELDAVWAESPE